MGSPDTRPANPIGIAIAIVGLIASIFMVFTASAIEIRIAFVIVGIGAIFILFDKGRFGRKKG